MKKWASSDEADTMENETERLSEERCNSNFTH